MDDRYKLITGFGDVQGFKQIVYKWMAKHLYRPLRKRVVDSPVMLFDIRDDPYEENNIAAENPEIVEKMMKKIVRIRDDN